MKQSRRRSVSPIILIAAMLSFKEVLSFPSQPGACPSGRAATNGYHVAPNPLPSFADLAYDFLVDGKVVSDSTLLILGERHEFSVRANANPFRGALIRVDGMGILESGTNSEDSAACAASGADGVGHSENSEKTILSGFYQVLAGESVVVDVTVVEQNRLGVSIYSYERFTLRAVDTVPDETSRPVASSTSSPVVAPTASPIRTPTNVPVVSPTSAPVVSPTEKPVVSPTEAPIVSPTEAPVVSPTEVPVVSPTEAPVVSPTEVPIVSPTEVPVLSPTEAPVVLPTEVPVVSPTEVPVVSPTKAPIVSPTEVPVASPTEAPVVSPTDAPVVSPTDAPVVSPTEAPVVTPRNILFLPTNPPVVSSRLPLVPTKPPTEAPIEEPTDVPVVSPTKVPVSPTKAPMLAPTAAPVVVPATMAPIASTTASPVAPMVTSVSNEKATSSSEQLHTTVTPRIVSFVFVDVAKGVDDVTIPDDENTEFSRSALPHKLSLRAVTDPPIVGSVQFFVNGSLERTENKAPYALAGDIEGSYWDAGLSPGVYNITATIYSDSKGDGEELHSVSRIFTIVA